MKETDDKMFMRRCLQLAANGLLTTRPNPMVGAVIVARGRIIGEGCHLIDLMQYLIDKPVADCSA